MTMQLFQKPLKKSVGFIASFSLVVSLLSGIPGHAQATTRPAAKDLGTSAVPLTQAPFLFYFPYGSTVSDIDVQGQAATATLTNSTNPGMAPAFEFVPAENLDIFNGDPNRLAGEATPAGPTAAGCKVFATETTPLTPKYTLPASFFTATGMNKYGLQTAKSTAASSTTFKQKSSGCMGFRLKVSANAKAGDQTKITFDEDGGLSVSYQEAQRPAIQTATLTVSAPVVASSSSVVSSLMSSSKSSSSVMMYSSVMSSSVSSSPMSSSKSSVSVDPCKLGSYFDIFGGIQVRADGTTTTTTTPATTTTTPGTTTTTTMPGTTTTTPAAGGPVGTNSSCNAIVTTKTVTTGGFETAVVIGILALLGGGAVMYKTRKREVKVDIGSK